MCVALLAAPFAVVTLLVVNDAASNNILLILQFKEKRVSGMPFVAHTANVILVWVMSPMRIAVLMTTRPLTLVTGRTSLYMMLSNCIRVVFYWWSGLLLCVFHL
jgi:hypothetical protein